MIAALRQAPAYHSALSTCHANQLSIPAHLYHHNHVSISYAIIILGHSGQIAQWPVWPWYHDTLMPSTMVNSVRSEWGLAKLGYVVMRLYRNHAVNCHLFGYPLDKRPRTCQYGPGRFWFDESNVTEQHLFLPCFMSWLFPLMRGNISWWQNLHSAWFCGRYPFQNLSFVISRSMGRDSKQLLLVQKPRRN